MRVGAATRWPGLTVARRLGQGEPTLAASVDVTTLEGAKQTLVIGPWSGRLGGRYGARVPFSVAATSPQSVRMRDCGACQPALFSLRSS